MPGLPRAVQERPVHVDITVTCSACNRVVPFASPRLRGTCPGCREPVEVSATLWSALFREIDEKCFALAPEDSAEYSAEQTTPAGRLIARWRAFAPHCAKCDAELMLVEPGTDDTIACGACNTRMTSFPAPVWLRTELPTVMQLYGASRELEAGEASTKSGFWVTFKGTPPHVSAQHQHAIKAAIGPLPEPPPVVSVASPKTRRRGWEWYAILICCVLIAVAVHRCGAKMGSDARPKDGTEVEPTQPP